MDEIQLTAAAEGMPNFNRRKALAVTGSGLAATIAAMVAPRNAAAAVVVNEAPVTRVNNLAWALARAMDDWMVDLGVDGVPDIWKAHVYPYSQRKHPVAFESLDRSPSPSARVAELEAAFHAEWAALRAIEPALNAAELRYMEIKGSRPVMGEMTPEEADRLRSTTVADLAKLPPNRASVEHAEAMRAYNKADAAARRKTGYGKLDRAYMKATHRTSDVANALLRHPAMTLEDLASKVRVHRVWEYDGEDFNFIMDDIARVAGKAGAS
ncbi:hypothetical protein [Mesorhizobium sp. NZP2077]|uniref:hypothetical protein n=1 Tax=Mesorhizobium sp. NZP2077 TaxID=2483404 RepID=UPI00155182BF|nr:hypothetical protein [Mesorhizobium sp. NZP2077]QKC83962.1 hypothetical protein EB232_22300 [Mesorhizobium sp. NZP2077]QKD17497.1 hypothetical protein HGP13_22000 [Mesorhizobium sp. NZP2077]